LDESHRQGLHASRIQNAQWLDPTGAGAVDGFRAAENPEYVVYAAAGVGAIQATSVSLSLIPINLATLANLKGASYCRKRKTFFPRAFAFLARLSTAEDAWNMTALGDLPEARVRPGSRSGLHDFLYFEVLLPATANTTFEQAVHSPRSGLV
jgi:hypothetical protein